MASRIKKRSFDGVGPTPQQLHDVVALLPFLSDAAMHESVPLILTQAHHVLDQLRPRAS